jgi:hypothetical protein
MNKLIKLLSLALACMLLFASLAACGDELPDTTEPEVTEPLVPPDKSPIYHPISFSIACFSFAVAMEARFYCSFSGSFRFYCSL